MDEDLSIINRNSRNEKIKIFFTKNKKKIITIIVTIIIIVSGYFIYEDLKIKNKIKLANKYNFALINFESGNKSNVKEDMIEIVNLKDKTYSPLALYFLIDNNIIKSEKKINELFDILIHKTSLEKEIKNLIIYKKALFNSNFETENNLIQILNPIINSESVWKPQALYLMGEYFFAKNEKQKSKDFFNQILTLENVDSDLKQNVTKRVQRDFSE